jgi:hypothetical protein
VVAATAFVHDGFTARRREATVPVGWTVLAESRRLTDAEQAVLDRLVAHAGNAVLTAQAASAWVTAVCDCGCGSIRLHSDAAPLSPAAMSSLSRTGRDDWFSIDCTRLIGEPAGAERSAGTVPTVQIVVHVTEGLLHELEIYAGEGVAVEVPAPDELDEISLN